MDEFDKIKELSDDIVGGKEPSFQGDFEENTEEEGITSPLTTDPLPPMEAMIEKNRSLMKWHLLALGGFVGILIIVLIGFLIWGDDSDSDRVVTITATPEPVRVQPDQAGGMAIPDQDKLIYNRTKEEVVKIEKLFPEPEKPVLPEIMLKAAEPPVVPTAPEKIAPVKVVVEQPKNTDEPSVVKTQKKPQKAEGAAKQVVQKAKNDSVKGIWRVQLMSTQKKATAEKAWLEISKKQKNLLSDMSHDIVAAEIAGKGTFYRLQVGHFTTREQASNLCAKLKANKQDCVPAK